MTAANDNLAITDSQLTEETFLQTEERLEQLCASEKLFRGVFENSPIGMALAGTDFHFIKANSAFCRMMGYSDQELTSLTFKDITHPDHLATDVEFVNKLLNGHISNYRTEKRYIRKNGDILWGSLTISAIRDSKGDFQYFLSMIEDITERKHDEAELQRLNEEFKERDRLKNEFVSTVSHELRTPLCVFKNVISNALAGVTGPVNLKLRKNLEMANQNIDRLSRIVNNFLDVARLEAGRVRFAPRHVDIWAVIREVIDAFAPIAISKNVSLDTVMPHNDIVIEGDHDKLVQVLTNLVGNAFKFIQTNGHILVTLSDYSDQISVSVHDDGPGIEPRYLDKLFNRFELGVSSTRSGLPSTGLGLAISKELIEIHHGRIWAESVFGRGSTFTFVLPKKQSNQG